MAQKKKTRRKTRKRSKAGEYSTRRETRTRFADEEPPKNQKEKKNDNEER